MLVVIIGIAEWPQYARTVRASVLAEKKKEYVEAAKVMGFRAPRIMFRHILPNCLSPILVISTVQVANAIMSEAALSFLGLGMPVDQPSLGSLISVGFNYIFSGSWWITAFRASAWWCWCWSSTCWVTGCGMCSIPSSTRADGHR